MQHLDGLYTQRFNRWSFKVSVDQKRAALLEDLLELYDHRRAQFEESSHGLLHFFAAQRRQVHFGFFCLRDEFRVLHRFQERAA